MMSAGHSLGLARKTPEDFGLEALIFDISTAEGAAIEVVESPC